MRTAIAILLAFVFSVPAIAADPPKSIEEAQAELDRKQAQREAAATQPANISQGELDALRAEVMRLRAENARLRAEIQSLRQDSSKQYQAPHKPKTTFTDRAKEATKRGVLVMEDGRPYRAKFNKKDADETLAQAQKIDKAIQSYLNTHDVADDVAESLWAGKPAIGMDREALLIFGQLGVKSETTNAQIAKFVPWDPTPRTYEDTIFYWLTLEENVVTRVTTGK